MGGADDRSDIRLCRTEDLGLAVLVSLFTTEGIATEKMTYRLLQPI